MKIIEGNIENINIDDKLCIALGTFDGIHIGHRRIINKTVQKAKNLGIKSAVLTFDNHPCSIIRPDKKIVIITDNNIKSNIMESLGVDYLFFIKFDKNFADILPIDFIKLLTQNFNAKAIACGYNYTFGKMGQGNTKVLEKYKETYDYNLMVMEPVKYENQIVSSSLIRKKILCGNIKDANKLLGYNLYFKGSVVEGKKLGRKLGFPTANIYISENQCIKNGVYATCTFIDEKVYPSISNVGYNPTFESEKRVIETHIFNFKENLYGKELKIEFIDFIRDDMKFLSVDDLKNQVKNDIETVKLCFNNNNVYNH